MNNRRKTWLGPSAGPPPKLPPPPPAAQELTTAQLAQILADNAYRLAVWSPPHLRGVASVAINGGAVQLNIETGFDDD